MWTPGIDMPGICYDGPCTFNAWLDIDIWTPAAPGVPVEACVWVSGSRACGPFPIPQDPGKPVFTQRLNGPFSWGLQCGGGASGWSSSGKSR